MFTLQSFYDIGMALSSGLKVSGGATKTLTTKQPARHNKKMKSEKKLKVSWIRKKNLSLFYLIPFPLLRKNKRLWNKIIKGTKVRITVEIIEK